MNECVQLNVSASKLWMKHPVTSYHHSIFRKESSKLHCAYKCELEKKNPALDALPKGVRDGKIIITIGFVPLQSK